MSDYVNNSLIPFTVFFMATKDICKEFLLLLKYNNSKPEVYRVGGYWLCKMHTLQFVTQSSSAIKSIWFAMLGTIQ